MAARTPRRSFATPFVVTLAAAPACYVQSAPPKAPQPAPTQTAQPDPAPAPGPGPVVVNPPRPQPTPTTEPASPPPVAPMSQKWSVYRAKDGCMAAVQVTCPPGTMCNPPPPFKYECPSNVSLDKPVTVKSSPDGQSCYVEYPPVKCPPNVACNPPRPTPVTCPTR